MIPQACHMCHRAFALGETVIQGAGPGVVTRGESNEGAVLAFTPADGVARLLGWPETARHVDCYASALIALGTPEGPKHFFDSWGAMWTPCDPGHPQAESFGPTGTARPCACAEVGFAQGKGQSAWSAAGAAGLPVLRDPDGCGPDILAHGGRGTPGGRSHRTRAKARKARKATKRCDRRCRAFEAEREEELRQSSVEARVAQLLADQEAHEAVRRTKGSCDLPHVGRLFRDLDGVFIRNWSCIDCGAEILDCSEVSK